MKYRIFKNTESADGMENAEPLQEFDSEEKFIRFLLRTAENEHEEFQLDYVRNADDADDLSGELDLCVDEMEVRYYSDLVQTDRFPVLGILRYDESAKILQPEQINWRTLAEELLGFRVECFETAP